jgi:hypothetical protein
MLDTTFVVHVHNSQEIDSFIIVWSETPHPILKEPWPRCATLWGNVMSYASPGNDTRCAIVSQPNGTNILHPPFATPCK